MSDIQAGFRMLDAFTSVGADSFAVTKTDIGQNLKWGKPYSAADLRVKLPAMMRTAAIRRPSKVEGAEMMGGENLIIRPVSGKVHFVQLDDLDVAGISRVGEAAFLTIETSPGNYQAWVAVSGINGPGDAKDFARRLKTGTGGQHSASGATRLAGTENFKAKYSPDFPTVIIHEMHPGRVVTQEQLEAMGLLAAPGPESAKSNVITTARRTGPSDYRPQKNKAWPNYAISLNGAPRNHSGQGPDRSMADFTWCMTAIDWGWPIEETAQKLPEVSEKARERVQMGDEGYPLVTAQNASTAVEHNALKRGRG